MAFLLHLIQQDWRTKEGTILFNDALNTLHGFMVKEFSYNEKETRCSHMSYSFRLAKKNMIFYMQHSTDMIAHTTAFVVPVAKQWLEEQ